MDTLERHLPQILWAFFSTISLTISLREWLRRRGWQGWPQAEGKVESVKVIIAHDAAALGHRQNQRYIARISYSYQVHGEYYGGNMDERFVSSSKADAYAEQFRQGQVLMVRYKSGEPDVSVIRIEDQPKVV